MGFLVAVTVFEIVWKGTLEPEYSRISTLEVEVRCKDFP